MVAANSGSPAWDCEGSGIMEVVVAVNDSVVVNEKPL